MHYCCDILVSEKGWRSYDENGELQEMSLVVSRDDFMLYKPRLHSSHVSVNCIYAHRFNCNYD